MFGKWFNKKTAKADNSKAPNFSDVDAQEAEQLFRQGQLEKLYLMPLEFGGLPIPPNTVYVPIGISAVKQGIDSNVVRRMLESGAASQYSASPEYQGTSCIPMRIRIRAFDPGDFSTELNIWGDALSEL